MSSENLSPLNLSEDLSTVLERARQMTQEARDISGRPQLYDPEISAVPTIQGAGTKTSILPLILIGGILILFSVRK